jgi:RNA methyltransferase, TrmH family
MKTVSSKDNAAYKAMARLASSSSERKKTGLTVIEGAHLLAAFLDSGRTPEAVMVSKAGLESPEVARLAERSAPARVTLLADALFAAISSVESPTGVIASVRTPEPQVAPADASLVLLLEDIQDPGNVGTLLRSAAAAGASHVLLSARCAFAWSPKVLRSAMGAHFALGIAEGVALDEWLAAYRGTSVALAGDAGASLYELDLRVPVAFVVGNEGAGLTPALQKAASTRARIPLAPRMESLNAASAGTIALFEAVRQRAAGGRP